MRLLPEDLPEEVSFSVMDGFYARKNEQGEVVHFGYYREGTPAGWVLDLGPNTLRVSKTEIVEMPGEDGELLSQEDVERWVDVIIREQGQKPVACAFCEKGQAEVLKLIAGPTCYICNECIELCHDILQTD